MLLSSISVKQCSVLVMYCIAAIKCGTIKLKDSERIILKGVIDLTRCSEKSFCHTL